MVVAMANLIITSGTRNLRRVKTYYSLPWKAKFLEQLESLLQG
jgi:hypothetical protein